MRSRYPATLTLLLTSVIILSHSQVVVSDTVQTGEGAAVIAFVSSLSGDPQQDFVREVAPGETFTVYVISGALPEMSSGYRIGLVLSEAATAALIEVRSLGSAIADQNSIGTFATAIVTVPPGCVAIDDGTVIAELDFLMHAPAIDFSIRVAGLNDTQSPPDYQTCAGLTIPFDVSEASLLSIKRPGQVPVKTVSWGSMKHRFGIE